MAINHPNKRSRNPLEREPDIDNAKPPRGTLTRPERHNSLHLKYFDPEWSSFEITLKLSIPSQDTNSIGTSSPWHYKTGLPTTGKQSATHASTCPTLGGKCWANSHPENLKTKKRQSRSCLHPTLHSAKPRFTRHSQIEPHSAEHGNLHSAKPNQWSIRQRQDILHFHSAYLVR
jgi:hypothetical protein